MDQDDTTAPISKTPTPKTTDSKWIRRLLFFILFFLIILSYSNLIIATIFAALVNLLSISIFDSIANAILEYCGKVITILGSILTRSGNFLFVKHLTSFGRWFASHIGRWFEHHRPFVTNTLTLVITIIVLAATILRPSFATTFGNVNDYVCLKTSLPWSTCASGVGVSTLPDGVRIGLVTDNTYGPFDQSLDNQDEVQVEKLIFGENKQVCTGQHMTLVAVTMLSRTVEDPGTSATLGVQDLEGNYLIQHHYNATHPALPLCLAIANMGTSDTADAGSPEVAVCVTCYSMPLVMHQIAQFAHADPSVRGIVGLPYSQQVKEALQIIKDNEQSLTSLPIISPSASSDNFSNLPNFYRVNSPDQNQAVALAQYFCSNLVRSQSSPSIAILTDPTNYFSGDLAIDFQNALNKLNCIAPAKIFSSIRYTNYDPASVQNAVHQALQDGVNYIFFPGYDQDMDTVEEEVYNDLPNSASSVTIIGGDGINNVNATTHYSYTRVYSANFAQPLLRTGSFVNDFINDGFAKAYATQTPTIDPSYFWMPTDTFLAIDAVQAVTQTVQALPDIHFTQSDFNTVLQSISFQGVTGGVTLQGNRVNSRHISDRTQESVYITCYDTKHILHLVDSYLANTDDASAQEDTSIPNRTACS